jgi:hypothetical protein
MLSWTPPTKERSSRAAPRASSYEQLLTVSVAQNAASRFFDDSFGAELT